MMTDHDGPPDQTKLTERESYSHIVIKPSLEANAEPTIADHTAFRVCIDCSTEYPIGGKCPKCSRGFEKPHETLIGTGLP